MEPALSGRMSNIGVKHEKIITFMATGEMSVMTPMQRGDGFEEGGGDFLCEIIGDKKKRKRLTQKRPKRSHAEEILPVSRRKQLTCCFGTVGCTKDTSSGHSYCYTSFSKELARPDASATVVID